MKGFQNARAYIGGKFMTCDILFDEKIQAVGTGKSYNKIDLPQDALVLPGFIDEHIHGAGGADTMDGSVEALSVMADTLTREGTTTFLATTMTQSHESIRRALRAVKAYRQMGRKAGARLAGVHLEGPFIAEAHKGAQPAAYIAKPSVETFKAYQAESGDCIKIVTLAPEEAGAAELVDYLSAHGVISSIGHTSAKYTEIQSAVERGATHITHTFNAQSPLHHREIGTVGSALLLERLVCELIADGIHVSVPAMKLLYACKKDTIILITDAMRAKGLGDCESELGGQKVLVKNGEARLENGTLAGSVLCMNLAIKNAVEKVGVPLETAVKFVTENPARALGIYDETGSIEVGKRADFAVLDKNYNILMTVRDGEIVYRA